MQVRRGAARIRRAALDEDREVARRRIAQQRRQRRIVGELHRVQAHAERGLDRVVPAGFDVDRLPQALGALEAVGLRPSP